MISTLYVLVYPPEKIDTQYLNNPLHKKDLSTCLNM